MIVSLRSPEPNLRCHMVNCLLEVATVQHATLKARSASDRQLPLDPSMVYVKKTVGFPACGSAV